jgi:PAS domain S-box-containing protein
VVQSKVNKPSTKAGRANPAKKTAKRLQKVIVKKKNKARRKGKKVPSLRIGNYARSLIEASLDPLFTINTDGKITDMNNASVNVTGKSRENSIGTDFFSYFTEPAKARKGYQQVFAKGFVSNYPLTIRAGKFTDVLFNGSVYKDKHDKVLGVVVVARDITEMKRVTHELTEAIVFAELATGFAEAARTKAELATQIAEDAVKAKQQFLSNMSHEIRTPMNAILGFTKVILKTKLSPEQNEYLNAIKTSGHALLILINDILDLAKVDAGRMIFEEIPFKISSSLEAMLHLFKTKIQEQNLTLELSYDPNVPEVLLGDPVRLHQIILNLMSNAVKFTPSGKITVDVTLQSEDDDKAVVAFAITDTGIGIASADISKIFEMFRQASSGTTRLYGGTGLGLAIVKQLVESQGGTIAVKSALGVGSTFQFILSFRKTTARPAIEEATLEFDPKLSNVRVLVVEDMALNQLLMKTLLDDFGFECDIASDGDVAIEKLRANSYDIILMDLQMPRMNGFETTDYIRNTMKSDIPIIALTADVTTVDLEKSKATGMNDYISKPVDEKLLYSKIAALINKSTSNDAISIPNQVLKQIDLSVLNRRTKSNPALMLEIISIYLSQTPPLIRSLREGLQNRDWQTIYSSAHKLLPSFSVMGISAEFEIMTRKIQNLANERIDSDEISDLVDKVCRQCQQSCNELSAEYQRLRTIS